MSLAVLELAYSLIRRVYIHSIESNIGDIESKYRYIESIFEVSGYPEMVYPLGEGSYMYIHALYIEMSCQIGCTSYIGGMLSYIDGRSRQICCCGW